MPEGEAEPEMKPILNTDSMAQTLWSLERARLEGRPQNEPAVSETLRWIAGRQGLPGAYATHLFMPTQHDVESRNGTPTYEDNSMSRVGVIHVLGEESARALALWGVDTGWDREKASRVIASFDRGSARFCCYRCSVAWWRALSATRIPACEAILARAVRWVEDSMERSRPYGFPFFYLLLALSEMPIPEVERLKPLLRPPAERALKGLVGNDTRTFFRRCAAEWAVS